MESIVGGAVLSPHTVHKRARGERRYISVSFVSLTHIILSLQKAHE
jgi:hypothetical protein